MIRQRGQRKGSGVFTDGTDASWVESHLDATGNDFC